jgi:IS30 family transposase
LRCRKKWPKRYGSYDRRGIIPKQVSIDERPAVVDTRQRYGDW